MLGDGNLILGKTQEVLTEKNHPKLLAAKYQNFQTESLHFPFGISKSDRAIPLFIKLNVEHLILISLNKWQKGLHQLHLPPDGLAIR